MRFCNLGKTGVAVSVLGFGASALGGVFGQVTEKESVGAVRRAIELGINVFDVSPYYGLTLAEERLGNALAGMRKDVLLGTKCGRYGVDRFDFSAATVTAEFENSLRRLRTDHVDILLVHDIEFGSIEQIVGETLPALRRLQDQGKTRFIGMSSYWPGLLANVSQRFPVDCVLNYCHANLMMDDMHDILTPLAQRTGLGLFNASPLHMGLLSGAAPPAWHPAPERIRVAAKDVAHLCLSRGFDPAQVAIRECLNVSGVASIFTGMASASQVDANCKALDLTTPPDLLQAIEQRLRPVLNTLWSSGRPENDDRARTQLDVVAPSGSAR